MCWIAAAGWSCRENRGIFVGYCSDGNYFGLKSVEI